MSKIRIGVDIGATGAYAIIKDNALIAYGAILYIKDEADMSALSQCLYTHIQDKDDVHVVIEDLHAVFGSSAASNFTFGVNNGLVIGLLQVLQIPYTKIGPKKWQKQAWEGIRVVEKAVMKKAKGQTAVHEKNKKGELKYKVDTKATSLIAAKRLFPTQTFLATERSKVPHNGIVDAALLAWYCNKNF